MYGTYYEQVPDDPVSTLFGPTPITLRQVTQALKKATHDERIEAVWLQPRNIGVSWAALGEIRAALQALKESGKPPLGIGRPQWVHGA